MHFAFVITLSAFLIFLVQPLIAKQILPWFGGTAAVWTTCMVFFQTALLAGYREQQTPRCCASPTGSWDFLRHGAYHRSPAR